MKIKQKDIKPITYSHFQASLRAVRPSVPRDSLAELFEWNNLYGSKLSVASPKSQKQDENEEKSSDGQPSKDGGGFLGWFS